MIREQIPAGRVFGAMLRAPAIAMLLVVGCGAPNAALPQAPAPAQPAPPATATAAAPSFDFHAGFWVNLHQRLYAESGLSARSRPIEDPLHASTPADQSTWDRAVAFYETRYPERGLITLWSNPELMAVNDALSRAEAATSLAGAGVPAELEAALEAAAPVYRAYAWPADEKRDIALRDRLAPFVARLGPTLFPALAKAYDTKWPSAPLRVDLAAYAGPVGAYTITEPPHLTIANNDARHAGDAAIEVLFHEASHVLVRRVEDSIARAAKAQSKDVPPSLWHAVLFYFTGEIVRRELGPSYVPYASKNGLYDRDPVWHAAEPLLERYWPAYLDGTTSLDVTIDRIVAGLP